MHTGSGSIGFVLGSGIAFDLIHVSLVCIARFACLHCSNVPPARDVEVTSKNNLVHGFYGMFSMDYLLN